MATDTDLKNLINTIHATNKEIATLKSRINLLVDEVHVLKSDTGKFKSDVASDVKYLTERIDGGR
jgi:regulator of replication initiation timing